MRWINQRWAIFSVTLVVLLCLVAWGALQYLRLHQAFPLKKVTITGAYQQIGEARLQQGLMPFLDKGLLNVSTDKIRHWVQNHYPSISDVDVSYTGFNSVRIHLQQHIPIAKLPDGELLSISGQYYKPVLPVDTSHIPLLKTDKIDVQKWMQQYHHWQAALLPLQLHITQIQHDVNGWRIELNQHISLMLGRDDIIRRFKTFIKIYPYLTAQAPKHKQLAYIDLRYRHGFAVQWQSVKNDRHAVKTKSN